MAKVVASKLKLLHLARLFEAETDDEHGLTAPQIIEKMAELGISVERKTLYRDIECLREFGYDIIKYERRPVEYGLASRPFEEAQLMLLADAVQSSRFLTKAMSDKLLKAIGGLGSKYMAESLRRRLHVEGRIKSQNRSVYYNLDAIQRAMNQKRKVEFKYFKFDAGKNHVYGRGGGLYVETPVQLMYMDEQYYLIVWNDRHDGFANYRVDRMAHIEVSQEPATRNAKIAKFKPAEYQRRVFGMFSGEPVDVCLLVDASAMSTVIDRFGEDVWTEPAGEGLARVRVPVLQAPTFYGWLATLGPAVKIESPASLREAYKEHLEAILDGYR